LSVHYSQSPFHIVIPFIFSCLSEPLLPSLLFNTLNSIGKKCVHHINLLLFKSTRVYTIPTAMAFQDIGNCACDRDIDTKALVMLAAMVFVLPASVAVLEQTC